MVKKMNFKSAAAYKKWIAFGHAAHVFKSAKPHSRVAGNILISIKGKPHKVTHLKPISIAKKSRR